MKKSVMILGCAVIALLISIIIFAESARFRELRSAGFSRGYYTQTQWVDDHYLVLRNDEHVSLWDALAGKRMHTFQSTVPTRYDQAVAVSSPSQMLATFDGRVLHVWDLFQPEPFFVWTVPGDDVCEKNNLSNDNFSSRGEWLLIGCLLNKQSVSYLVNVETRAIEPFQPEPWDIFDPYAQQVIFGFNQETKHVYALDVSNQEVMWSTPIVTQGNVYLQSITETALFVCHARTCFLLDRHTGALQHTFQFDRDVYNTYLTTEYVVVIQELGRTMTRIEVWDTATGGELRQIDISLPSSLTIYEWAHALSRDGMLAISFYQWDHKPAFERQHTPVYIYDIATLERIATLDAHTDAVINLAFDPTGKYLFTGSRDNTFKIWEIEK